MRSLAKTTGSSLRRAASIGLLATGLVAASVGSAHATATPGHGAPVPPELKPPAGHVLAKAFSASGVQVYECNGGTWSFVEPAASLTDARGRTAAIHFRGPTWQSTTDGSLVVGKAVANKPVTGTIPLLLLEATDNRGDGLFGRVTYIQRLATQGGAAPTGPCEDGDTEGVPYRAQYRFFVEE
ncbi:DUF3455 domain-containing protein [Thermopolyspora sp. NPDC052614]|uniref:DUF3455 domain-containing protein n=1 Tax=Thermopolyspora sp. NPDC052614 TaxID=3155682 RepID=UPI0034132BF3